MVGSQCPSDSRPDLIRTTINYPLAGPISIEAPCRFVERAGSHPAAAANKKGHLTVTFFVWRARQESNLQPPA